MKPLRPLPVLLLVILLGAPAAGRGATLRERAGAIDGPRLGPALRLEAPLAVGRGRITPGAGVAVYPLLADGEPCGVLVDGPATLDYRVEDGMSVPVAERNLSRGSKLKGVRSGDVLTVSEALDGAVVWGRGLPPPPAGTAGAGLLPQWAIRALATRRFAPASHGLLAEEANGGEGYRFALLAGKRGTLVLAVDPAEQEEGLYKVAPTLDPGSSFREGMRPSTLASQPLGRRWWDRVPRQLLAVHEALQVENPAGDRVHVVSRSTLHAERAGAGLWSAQLVDVLYDSKGRERPITVRSVRVDGKPADFLHDDGELLVAFGRTLRAGETVQVEVDYEGDLALRPSGNSYWVLGTFPWYPRQYLGGERATLEIQVDVPAPWTPFASGTEVARTATGERRRVSTRLDHPVQFAVVAAGSFGVVEETRGDITCRAATYATRNERAAKALIGKFFDSLSFFEPLFDQKYPFRSSSIIEIASWGFGQAPPGVLFFTHEFYTAPLPGRTRRFFGGRDPRFLHEVAHGWWGHVARMPSEEESWWSEAFADYSAALAFWRLRGGSPGKNAFDDIVGEWARGAADLAPGASLYLATHLSFEDDRDVDDFWRLRYAKGPLVVHAIRLELQRLEGSEAEGDRYFIAFLRAYLKRTKDGFATTPEMVKTLGDLTGKDWQPFFERYVYGTETPKVPYR